MARFHVSAVAAALLTLLIGASPSVSQEDGFKSINCGGKGFRDSKTKIIWDEDPFNNDLTGLYGNISEVHQTYENTTAVMSTLRYFPNNKKNTKFCYSLPAFTGNTYLVRASFYYGNYDGLNQPPMFLLIINYDHWVNVNILSSTTPVMQELIFSSNQENISICLAPLPSRGQNPFISSLELRRLEVDMYINTVTPPSALSSGQGLRLWKRINYGARNEAAIRYPDDRYDRIWEANTTGPTLRLSTSEMAEFYGTDPERPPKAVMTTAITSQDPQSNLTLTYEGYGGVRGFRVDMHFQELDKKAQGQIPAREFNLNIPNISMAFTQATLQQLPIALSLNASNTVYFDEMVSLPTVFQINFYPADSTLRGPMLNAIELFHYTAKRLFSIGTFPNDVLAIMIIQEHFNITGYGQGDPCMPQDYKWAWIQCNEASPPQITEINLASLSLTGDIPPIINNLTSLKSINLSHNMLNGPIPDLSNLINLKILDVSNNTLCGSFPPFIFQPSITFKSDGNDRLCNKPKCICPSSKSSSTSTTKYIIAISFLSGLYVLSLLALLVCFKAQRIRTKRKKAALAIEANQKAIDGAKVISYGTKVFTYNEISNATLNFTTILGQGGFGKVYHGLLPSGEAIAVKLLADVSKQGLKEFYNEVAILSKVCHKNLVSLLGYCVENTYMLIYEYIEKGNLRDLLYGDMDSLDRPLSWKTRLHIALDASQGLEYLHTGCDPIVIHRDVKSSNILLGEKMQAKVADFGLSRLKEGDITMSHVSTVNVVGTAGYLDPAYNATNQLTDKSDVYSFGIVLLELICGRPPIDMFNSPPHIVEWASSYIMQGKVKDIVDPLLANGYRAESMWKAVDVALGCVESDRLKRPKMSQVSQMLQSALELDMDESLPLSSKDVSNSSSTSNEKDLNLQYIKKFPMVLPR